MAERLGNVLYWLCCAVGLVVGVFLLLAFLNAPGFRSTDTPTVLGMAGAAFAITFGGMWAIGRALRYILAGR